MLSLFSNVCLFATQWTVAHQAPLSMGLRTHKNPDKNTGMGCHVLLQGIFLPQVWNLSLLHLLHWQEGSLPLVSPGKPRGNVSYLNIIKVIYDKAIANMMLNGEEIIRCFALVKYP